MTTSGRGAHSGGAKYGTCATSAVRPRAARSQATCSHQTLRRSAEVSQPGKPTWCARRAASGASARRPARGAGNSGTTSSVGAILVSAGSRWRTYWPLPVYGCCRNQALTETRIFSLQPSATSYRPGSRPRAAARPGYQFHTASPPGLRLKGIAMGQVVGAQHTAPFPLRSGRTDHRGRGCPI